VFSSAPFNFDGGDKMLGSDCDIINSLCYCECCSSGSVCTWGESIRVIFYKPKYMDVLLIFSSIARVGNFTKFA